MYSSSDEIILTDILIEYNNYEYDTVFSNVYINSINNDPNLYDDSTQYFPLIYISNLSCLNTTYRPILAFGFDLENEDDSVSYYVYGRFYNQNNGLVELSIDEANGFQSSIPILIVTVGAEDNSTKNIEKHELSLTSCSSGYNDLKSSYFISKVDEYKINYRYEKSNRSEYSSEHVCLYTSGGHEAGGIHDLIRRIHKDDVGKTTFYTDHNIWVCPLGTMSGYWYVTFEYDWWAKKKPVVVPGPMGSEIVECKMGKKDEYFQRIFYYVPITFPPVEVDDGKGHLEIINY